MRETCSHRMCVIPHVIILTVGHKFKFICHKSACKLWTYLFDSYQCLSNSQYTLTFSNFISLMTRVSFYSSNRAFMANSYTSTK